MFNNTVNASNVSDWYWLGPSGVFSTARKGVFPVTDSAYLEWLTQGNLVSQWPKDEAGNQTNQALDDVLATYGMSSGLVPPTVAQLLAYASNKQNTVLAQVWTFNVAASGPAHNVTTALDMGGQFSMLKIESWAQLNANVSGATLPYSNVDFSSTTLTAAEASSLGEQAGVVDANSYATLNTVAAGINANPPTITTYAQIDAASWPTPAS